MKNELVKIQNHEVTVREYNGQRVITFKDIDTVHERADGTARKRFNDNKKHFVEGEDYFVLKTDEAQAKYGVVAPKGLTLVTQSGYLMLVKSFTDDLAWKVQKELVNSYFTIQQSNLSLEGLSPELQAVIVVDKRVTKVENRIEKLENNMTITHEQIQTIKNRINKVIVELLGGKESNAYKDKTIRSKAYSKINSDYCNFFRINARANTLTAKYEEALQYIDMWQPDTNLRIQIQYCNAQITMGVA